MTVILGLIAFVLGLFAVLLVSTCSLPMFVSAPFVLISNFAIGVWSPALVGLAVVVVGIISVFYSDDYPCPLPQLLGASDLFMFPSLQEGLPVSQMEAMAAGLPCVVSDIRGNADLIQPGEGGFLRKPFDHEGFAQDIALLLGDPALRGKMAERNRSIMHNYSLEAVQKQMTALYREQLNG